MLSQIPINLEKVKKENLDKEILRVGIIAELDAVSLYEQLAAMTEKERVPSDLRGMCFQVHLFPLVSLDP